MFLCKLTVLMIVLIIIIDCILKLIVSSDTELQLKILSENYPKWILIYGNVVFILSAFAIIGIIYSSIYLLFIR